MCLNRRLSSFLALLHIINWADQQLDKLEWWIWPLLWIDTNKWSIKILDRILNLRKYDAVKEKRRGCFEWYLFFWWKMKGKVFVGYLQATILEGEGGAAVITKMLNWKQLSTHTVIIHDSSFKGLNTCPLFCWKSVPKADRRKATVSLNYSHLCHLTLKSTKKDRFWVSMPFRRASNCSCPSWPSQSRLN